MACHACFRKLLPDASSQPHFKVEVEQLSLMSAQDPIVFFRKAICLIYRPQSGLYHFIVYCPIPTVFRYAEKVSNEAVQRFTFLLFASVELHMFDKCFALLYILRCDMFRDCLVFLFILF